MLRATTLQRVALLAVFICGCGEGSVPARFATAPNLSSSVNDRSTVLVNPHANAEGTASTIQEGIAMVANGGTLLVLPGTYNEKLTIDKSLTLQAVGGMSGTVVIEQVAAAGNPPTESAIRITTPDPVVLRNLELHHVHMRGLNIFTAANVTIENVSFRGEWPSPTPPVNNAVSVANNATQSGGRVRLVLRDSRISVDGNGVTLGGDVDALIERNTFSMTTHGACIGVSPTGQGFTVPAGAATNVDILDNELDDCGANIAFQKGPLAIGVTGVLGAATTGTVNIVGNTIRNTIPRAVGACSTDGILYQFYNGRIEHNRLIDVVEPCATPEWTGRSLPSAIFLGSLNPAMRPANVTVRFNDFGGNSFAALRLGPNQTLPIDATCNWWGDPSGPSGIGGGTGEALILETGAAAPAFLPFATTPIARLAASPVFPYPSKSASESCH